MQEIAEETWMKYLQRNHSVIVQEFQGQLKTTLVCPDCSEVSRMFDPFMFLSLRLPVKITRSIYESEVKDLCYNSEIAEVNNYLNLFIMALFYYHIWWYFL